jgi:putative addiction module component (TIGR02574 family)
MEQIHKLPFEEQYEVFAHLRDEFDPELTPEQVAELERRAEDALKNPGRGKSVEQVFAEIEERLRAKK